MPRRALALHPGPAGAGAEERGGGAAQRGRPAKCRQFGKPFLRPGRADRYPIAGNGHVQCHSLRRGISQPLYCQQHHRRDASSAAAAARSGLQPGGCTGAAKYAGNRCPQRHWRRCPAPYRYRRPVKPARLRPASLMQTAESCCITGLPVFTGGCSALYHHRFAGFPAKAPNQQRRPVCPGSGCPCRSGCSYNRKTGRKQLTSTERWHIIIG